LRGTEMTVCPATGFGYVANLELLAGSPSVFTRANIISMVFQCQGRDPNRGAHRQGDGWNIHQAQLGVSERVIPREEMEDLRRDLRTLTDSAGETPTRDQSRRIDALRQRLAALERAFSDGRSTTTVSRLTNDVVWAPYP